MSFDRRVFLSACTRAGVASPLLPGILLTLATQAQEAGSGAGLDATSSAGAEAKPAALAKITEEMIDRAAELAGMGPFTAEQKKMMLDGLNDQRDAYAQIRALKIGNDVPPAYVFHPGKPPAPPNHAAGQPCICQSIREIHFVKPDMSLHVPEDIENLAFSTVGELGALLLGCIDI